MNYVSVAFCVFSPKLRFDHAVIMMLPNQNQNQLYWPRLCTPNKEFWFECFAFTSLEALIFGFPVGVTFWYWPIHLK